MLLHSGLGGSGGPGEITTSCKQHAPTPGTYSEHPGPIQPNGIALDEFGQPFGVNESVDVNHGVDGVADAGRDNNLGVVRVAEQICRQRVATP